MNIIKFNLNYYDFDTSIGKMSNKINYVRNLNDIINTSK